MGGRRDNDHELPEGILTFLLTDIEGSTPLWERHRAVMGAALAQHESLVARAVAAHGGRLIKTRGEGDSTVSVFARASDAAAAHHGHALLARGRPGDRQRAKEELAQAAAAAERLGMRQLAVALAPPVAAPR
jgi:class 3 adenylate cyclase